MTPERKRPSQSAFERIKGIYQKLPGNTERGSARIPFEDGVIDIFHTFELETDGTQKEAYAIWGRNAPEGDLKKMRMSSFSITKEGLRWVRFNPDLQQDIQIGNRNIRISKPLINDSEKIYLSEENKENRQKMAGTLADWVDEAIRKQKFSHPPISLTITSK